LLPTLSPPQIYTPSLHDALPIWPAGGGRVVVALRQSAGGDEAAQAHVRDGRFAAAGEHDVRFVALHGAKRIGDGIRGRGAGGAEDRKSTRLNSSHQIISYAVFCF